MSALASTVIQFANFSEVVVVAANTVGNVELSNVEIEVFPSSSTVVTSSAPSGITITGNTVGSDVVCYISGSYQDFAVDDAYQVVDIVDDVGVFRTFTDFNQLNAASYDHIFNFSPQDWSYATFTYNLTVNVGASSFVTTMSQDVYPNMDRHLTRLASLVQRERIN